jgi:hypothetical protein
MSRFQIPRPARRIDGGPPDVSIEWIRQLLRHNRSDHKQLHEAECWIHQRPQGRRIRGAPERTIATKINDAVRKRIEYWHLEKPRSGRRLRVAWSRRGIRRFPPVLR